MRSWRRRAGWGQPGRPIQPDMDPEIPRPGLSEWQPTDATEAAAHRDAHRPVPGANAWPDDAVLLTYGEIRALIALHLNNTWQTMPNDHPWLWIRRRATSMLEGEAPLLLSEVLTSPDGLPPR